MLIRIVLGAGLLLVAGCGSLNVASRGTLPSGLLEPVGSHPEEPLLLGCDDLGNLSLNGQPVDVPVAREPSRFGVGLADAGELPPAWRPRHAVRGGLLVTWLHRQSPLAIAGLRPFDVLLAVEGVRVESPTEATRRLFEAGEREVEIEVVVRRQGSEQPEPLRVRSSASLGDLSRISFPFLFDRREGAAGDAFALGPLSTAFWWRTRRELQHEVSPSQSGAYSSPGFETHHEERFEWGVLGNLVYWERSRDLNSGKERSRLRLLWLFSFGDDL